MSWFGLVCSLRLLCRQEVGKGEEGGCFEKRYRVGDMDCIEESR